MINIKRGLIRRVVVYKRNMSEEEVSLLEPFREKAEKGEIMEVSDWLVNSLKNRFMQTVLQ